LPDEYGTNPLTALITYDTIRSEVMKAPRGHTSRKGKTMKKAKLNKYFTVEVVCPDCGAVEEGPSGALEIQDWEWKEVPSVIKCRSCGLEYQKPADPWAKRGKK
jgi:transcription elongation factor Elf1